MSLTRWKIMALILGVSLAGLVAGADTPSDELHRPAVGPDTTLPCPAKVELGSKPRPSTGAADTLPVLESPPIAVPKDESPAPPVRQIEFEIKLPPVLPEPHSTPRPVIVPDGGTVQLSGLPAIEVSGLELLPMPRMLDEPPMPERPSRDPLTEGPVELPPPLIPPPDEQPLVPSPPKLVPDPAPPEPERLLPPAEPVQAATTAPNQPQPPRAGEELRMTLRMGGGPTRFELRSTLTQEVLLKVSCDRVELKRERSHVSQLAGVTGVGAVRFTGPGIEGTCDQLCLLSGTGEVLLQGNVQLKTKNGRLWSELHAEKMIFQIGQRQSSTQSRGAP